MITGPKQLHRERVSANTCCSPLHRGRPWGMLRRESFGQMYLDSRQDPATPPRCCGTRGHHSVDWVEVRTTAQVEQLYPTFWSKVLCLSEGRDGAKGPTLLNIFILGKRACSSSLQVTLAMRNSQCEWYIFYTQPCYFEIYVEIRWNLKVIIVKSWFKGSNNGCIKAWWKKSFWSIIDEKIF